MILKVATGVTSDGSVNWKDLYANAIRLRLRRDRNLSDVENAKTSRDNLGVTKAIADAEQEAIDISVEYARKNDTLIWTRLDERMSTITEDIYYLKDNIGTWNYIDYENKVVDGLNFVDYVKSALQNLFNKIGDNEVALKQYVDDVADDTYDRVIAQMDLHYTSLNDLIKIWWEMFQDNLKRDINIMQRELERAETSIDIRLDAMDTYFETMDSNVALLESDIAKADTRITNLRDRTQTAFTDLIRYISDIVQALTEYTEETMRTIYGQLLNYIDSQISALDTRIEDLEKWKSDMPTDLATQDWVINTFLPNYVPKVWNGSGKLEFYYKNQPNGQIGDTSNAGDKKGVANGLHDIFWIDN